MEVNSRQLRTFAQDDIKFLENYANLLSSAIKRVNTQAEMAQRAQHEKVLSHELQHRINNILMTIRAVARRTLATSKSLEEFARSFDDRIQAIARTHALLSQAETSAVGIRKLLEQEMSAHGAVEGQNLYQRGPELLISAKQASAVHGFSRACDQCGQAWRVSVDKGRIDVCWKAEPSGADKRLCIRWRETGFAIQREPTRRGFGSDMLEKSIPKALQGRFERTIHPDGIECVIEFPLDLATTLEDQNHTTS